MPINLIEFEDDPLCFGFRWEITDEHLLSKHVANLMLGHYRHVQKVLAGLDSAARPQVTDQMIDCLVGELGVPANDSLRYHRDGWVFQMISWVAARIAEPGAIMSIPHPRKTQKGFDNLIVHLADERNTVAAVVISEDKATEHSRDEIRDKVWPAIEKCETGQRDRELVSEVSAILERSHDIVAVDGCVADIFWEGARRYRVSVTTDCQDDEVGRRRLFSGFDTKVEGDIKRRRGETVKITELRQWMDQFCESIIHCLEDMRCTTP